MKDNKNLSDLLNCHPIWGQNDTPIWLASRFSLKRNLSRFLFPSKMNETEIKQLTALLKQTLLKLPLLNQGLSFTSTELSPTQKEAIAEHFLMYDSHATENEAHLYLLDRAGSFLVKIQERDHLILECIDSESNWNVKWKKLVEFEKDIGKAHDFAFSPKFGYLSADPTFCGTGLNVEAFLHVPCLIHLEEIQEIFNQTLEEDVMMCGLGGSQEFIGDLIVVQNQFTLGVSEDHILDSVHRTAMELMTLEANRRKKLKESPDPSMLDKISRSYGLLLHSYQLETKEALAALSLLKIGIDLKWVSGITDRELSAIFFKCRRAHLKLQSKENLAPDQLAKKRAEYLQKQCEKIKLMI